MKRFKFAFGIFFDGKQSMSYKDVYETLNFQYEIIELQKEFMQHCAEIFDFPNTEALIAYINEVIESE